jgi:hypothetical protein
VEEIFLMESDNERLDIAKCLKGSVNGQYPRWHDWTKVSGLADLTSRIALAVFVGVSGNLDNKDKIEEC